VGGFLLKRQQGLNQEIKDIAWQAQWCLCTHCKKLAAAGKNKQQMVTAMSSELLTFAWAIVKTELQPQPQAA
jgi:transposase